MQFDESTAPFAIEGLLMAIEVHEEKPFLRLSPYQGRRILSTPRQCIYYGFQLMDLRLHEAYDQSSDEIKERWQSDADEVIERGAKPACSSIPLEVQLMNDVWEALRLQRNREKGEAHLSHMATLSVWMDTGERASRYLASVPPGVQDG
jgi:hypothetical protein